MSLPVVITPLTVTVATTWLDEDQLKFPLPPWAWGEASSVSPLPHPSLGFTHPHTHTLTHTHVVSTPTAWKKVASAKVWQEAASAPCSFHPVLFLVLIFWGPCG